MIVHAVRWDNLIRLEFGDEHINLSAEQAKRLIRDLHGAITEIAGKPEDDNEINTVIGRNIVRERNGVCMTSKQLADGSGLTTGFISDVENGKRGISSGNLLKISKTLGCTVQDLLRGLT